MTRRPHRSIEQLDFERRWLMAKVTHDDASEIEQNVLLRRVEDLELAIAATPVTDIDDLVIKVSRLAAVLHPSLEPIADDSIEAILVKAVVEGCRRLATGGDNEREGG